MGNQRGNLILVAVLGVAGFGCLIGAMLWWQGSRAPAGSAQDPAQKFAEYQKRIEQALASQPAVRFTLERNSSQFSCLFSDKGNCQGQGGAFLLFENTDLKASSLSQIVAGNGLDAAGLGCRGYPSAECPYRIDAQWRPVCAPTGCDSTQSLRVYVRLVYNEGDARSKREWQTQSLQTPQINLTARAACARQGGAFDGSRCLRGGEAVAANTDSLPGMSSPQRPEDNYQQGEEGRYTCPDVVLVQGLNYVPEVDEYGKAEVRVPAVNGCPAPDRYFFSCVAKNGPSSEDRALASEGEGQWMQVDAQLAPNCDDAGNPIPDEPTHLMEPPASFRQ